MDLSAVIRAIPRRPHEPYADNAVRLEPIELLGCAEGASGSGCHALTYNLYIWTSVITRARHLPPYFSRFLTEHGISSPVAGSTTHAAAGR
ncbi:MAG: hypothetical protein R2742_12900 [Micropruina glycogenica]